MPEGLSTGLCLLHINETWVRHEITDKNGIRLGCSIGNLGKDDGDVKVDVLYTSLEIGSRGGEVAGMAIAHDLPLPAAIMVCPACPRAYRRTTGQRRTEGS